MSEQAHSIIAFEQDFLEDGEVAVCTCGWRSERGTLQQIRAWHQTHASGAAESEVKGCPGHPETRGAEAVTSEQFVCDHWKEVSVGLHHGTSHGRVDLPYAYVFVSPDPGLAGAWEKAAEFTRKRLEQIRMIEEEIELIKRRAAPGPVFWRIIAREQQALFELRIGMKPEESKP